MASINENHQNVQRNQIQFVINKISDAIFWLFAIANIMVSIALIIGLTQEWTMKCNVDLRQYDIVIISMSIVPIIFETYKIISGITPGNLDQHKTYTLLRTIILTFAWIAIWIWGWILWSRVEYTCDNHMLINSTLAFLIINSIYLSLPFVLIIMTCLCFPCVILILGMLPESNDGLDQTVIDSLNEYEYMSNGLAQEIIDQDNGTQLNQFVIENQDDRACCICLMQYEPNDILRSLRCNHHMHKQCCDEWLKMNNSCPICRKPAVVQLNETIGLDV
jgi:hypothetical protein